MLQISKAFSFPFEDDNWPIKYLLGWIFMFIPIVNFFSKGYSYTVFKTALNKEELYMPEWDDFGGLFVQGFWIFLIQLCYYFIPLFLILSGFGLIGVGAYGMYNYKKGDEFVALILLGVFFLIVGFILMFIVMLLYPMAVAVYAKSGERFSAIFRLFDIIGKIFKVIGDYLLVIIILYAIVFGVIILSVIPFIGFVVAILNFLAVFYIHYLVGSALLGQACSKAFEDEVGNQPAQLGQFR